MSSTLLSQSSQGTLNSQRSFGRKLLPAAIGLTLGLVAIQEVAANTAGLTFYGRAHVSTDFLDNGKDSDFNVSSNSSRIGVKASTDITDGLRGILQVESTIGYDNGEGTWANRDTFVGLEGDFGRVRFGHLDTPLKLIRSTVDVFGDQIGDLRGFTRLHSNTNTPLGVSAANAPYGTTDFDARFKNGIFYNTNSFGGGFVFNFHYTPQTNSTSSTPDLDNDSSAFSTSLTYEAGNLYLAIAQEQWDNVAADGSNATRVGARYKAGDWTFGGLYQQATVKPLGDEKVQTIALNTSVKVSNEWLLKAQIANVDADTDDTGATAIAIGADYILSKQFRVLFAYAQADNDDAAAYRVTGGGGYGDATPTVVGETASGLSVGFRYDF